MSLGLVSRGGRGDENVVGIVCYTYPSLLQSGRTIIHRILGCPVFRFVIVGWGSNLWQFEVISG
jgi:hypothetical protein